MASGFFEGFLEFVFNNKWVIAFYLGAVLFVFLNRKRFDFQFKVIALYRAQWGISWMDRIASKFRELIKLLGYISIGVGFVGMAVMVVSMFYFLYLTFTLPNSPAAIAPVLPGIEIPGVPFKLPLVEGILAIFIVATIHEFAHGVVARAHDVKVKNTGIGMFGPVFIAFVEPDEKELSKRNDVVNYSIFSAGPVSNFFLFGILFLVLVLLVTPLQNALYPSQGISILSVGEGTPAEAAGLEKDAVYNKVNDDSVLSVKDLMESLNRLRPGDSALIKNDTAEMPLTLGEHPSDSSRPYLGVTLAQKREGSSGFSFLAFSWFENFLKLVALLSLGIGLGNLIPVGPIDGGRMMQQALQKLRGKKKGNRILVKLSILLLLLILALLYPIFRETFKLIFG